ncbi:MAG: long-subunit fatty acid transport protein [Myxococcota bacterium]|jgi:long-subunit fatty acid transport protein
MLLLIGNLASAASLDNIEVGGSWGSPTAENPTAAWWNPAGLSSGGHRILIEAAPTFGGLQFDRDEPHGGPDSIEAAGVVPFAGFSTDFGVKGLGFGGALTVPTIRGGESIYNTDEETRGSGTYHLRYGDIRAVNLILGASYRFQDLVAVGASVHAVNSSWSAIIDNDTMPDLYDEIQNLGQIPDPTIYNDENLENEEYATVLDLGPLEATKWTWGAGIQASPIEMVDIGIAYVAPVDLRHEGETTLYFSCPPQLDVAGRFGAESFGICDTTVEADAAISYTLPGRINAGVAVTPIDALRVEVMGGYVMWSAFKDFRVEVYNVAEKNPDMKEDTAELITQDRKWARDNQNSWFGGLDLKARPTERWTVGGRLLYDTAAVPDVAMAPNNGDADTFMLSGLVAFQAMKPLTIGLSGSRYFSEERTITDSGFSMSLDEDARPEDRWNYPHGNGTYNVSLTRIGISVLSEF